MRFERARSFFPVVGELVYLDHAGVSPISTRVEEALRRYAAAAARRGGAAYDEEIGAEVERVRGRAAVLLGATLEEVGFAPDASTALARLAGGLAWRRGDRVVCCALDPPGPLAVWRGLEPRGVQLELLHGRDGALPHDDLARALESRSVRLVSVSAVSEASGARLDLVALGALCRERGVLLCVDASQSLGCLPFDARAAGVDFACAPGHKWLCAPPGCGLLFCARRLLDRLAPSRGDPVLRRPAHRLDAAANPAGVYALGAAIDLWLEVGPEAGAARVLALAARLRRGLLERGAALRGPAGGGAAAASGIVTFTLPGEAPARTLARLRARGIRAGACADAVRASPHYYTGEHEIDAALAALA